MRTAGIPRGGRHARHGRSCLLVVGGNSLGLSDLETFWVADVEGAVALLSVRPFDAVVLAIEASTEALGALCGELRASRGWERGPLLVLVDPSLDDREVELLLASGATDIVSRPIPDAILAHRLRALVEVAHDQRGLASLTVSRARTQRVANSLEWWFDHEARTFRWSHAPNVNYPALEGEGPLTETFLRWVHPDDRARVERAVAALHPHTIDYRLVFGDGEERFVYQVVEHDVDPISRRRCLVGVVHDVTQLREAEAHVARLAHYDELTGLPNRSHACRFLKAAVASAKRCGRQVAVIVLDLDAFRSVNDTFGHAVGNEVLTSVGRRLKEVVAEGAVRTGYPAALVARLGGDEFAIVLRDLGDTDDPAIECRRLADAIAMPHVVGGREIVLSSSAGIASYPTNGSDVEKLLGHAVSANHVAKEHGRNTVRVFDTAVKMQLDRKRDVERRLRTALGSGTHLELHYQPKIDAHTKHVGGVEALLRWTPDSGGPISPPELITAAEDAGLMHLLGDWVLRTACRQAKAWSEGTRPVRVAVNVSGTQLGAEDFVERVARILEESELPADFLELEITEGVMVADAEAALLMLERLKRLGVRIALDDFGTGFSSLAYLTRFPIDCLKIDRSFVIGIGTTRKNEAILGAIVDLARSLGIAVVAEGVETEAQRAFLERHGPIEIQGWLFTKALPAAALSGWLEQHERGYRNELRAAG